MRNIPEEHILKLVITWSDFIDILRTLWDTNNIDVETTASWEELWQSPNEIRIFIGDTLFEDKHKLCLDLSDYFDIEVYDVLAENLRDDDLIITIYYEEK